MNDMVERGARAISDSLDPELWDLTNETWRINKRLESRAALLAALDLTDAELERVAKAAWESAQDDGACWIELPYDRRRQLLRPTRAAISSLRAAIQSGEDK